MPLACSDGTSTGGTNVADTTCATHTLLEKDGTVSHVLHHYQNLLATSHENGVSMQHL